MVVHQRPRHSQQIRRLGPEEARRADDVLQFRRFRVRKRRRKRAAIVKFSLAGAAVLGIGAAATTAVWTNDAWFSATAAAVDPATAINLQGAFNADAPGTEPTTGFTAADDDSAAIAIPSTVFADLVAGDTISTTVWLKNAGTSALQIAEPRLVVDGATYTIDNPAAAGLFAEDGATLEVTGAPNALEPGEVAPATVTIALDADASESFGGKSGDVLIQFQGSIANRTS